jgi:hypothetical protein
MLSKATERNYAAAHLRRKIGRAGGPAAAKKEDLAKIADEAGVVVTRSDGKDGEPRKEDYLRALGY